MYKNTISALVTFFLFLIAVPASADEFAVRANMGTDVSLGLGTGLGLRYFIPSPNGSLYEFGPDLYFAKTTETTEEFNTYTDTTELTIFAARINLLKNYAPKSDQLYYVFGTGAAAAKVYWQETSPTDTSLGTPLAGGGSKQEEEASAFAWLLSFGVGKTFGGNVDFRAEMPILVFFNAVGGAATFVPTVTAGVGYSF